jgi:hypothetical protein
MAVKTSTYATSVKPIPLAPDRSRIGSLLILRPTAL